MIIIELIHFIIYIYKFDGGVAEGNLLSELNLHSLLLKRTKFAPHHHSQIVWHFLSLIEGLIEKYYVTEHGLLMVQTMFLFIVYFFSC